MKTNCKTNHLQRELKAAITRQKRKPAPGKDHTSSYNKKATSRNNEIHIRHV